jgi:histidinol-phosphate aminotransferase
VRSLSGSPIILSSNENPLGPGKAVLDAVRNTLGATGAKAGRYPFSNEVDVADTIAKKFGVKRENVLIGCGSTQILRTVTHVYTAKDRPLVASTPAYEECAGYAALMGRPVTTVKLDSALRMDLDETLAKSKGAGLIFFCNPSNPTAALHSYEDSVAFIKKALAQSPNTTILADEAYIDYVSVPGHKSLVSMAIENPRVVVARTFSKAYGMAGLRMGYGIGHAQTIKELSDWDSGGSVNILGLTAGAAAIMQDASFLERERARNKEARDFTRDFFHKHGFKDTDSQANFLFVETRMPIQDFQKACRAEGVLVARPFPPLLNWARISIGTMEEMKQAVDVFAKVLKTQARTAA